MYRERLYGMTDEWGGRVCEEDREKDCVCAFYIYVCEDNLSFKLWRCSNFWKVRIFGQSRLLKHWLRFELRVETFHVNGHGQHDG